MRLTGLLRGTTAAILLLGVLATPAAAAPGRPDTTPDRASTTTGSAAPDGTASGQSTRPSSTAYAGVAVRAARLAATPEQDRRTRPPRATAAGPARTATGDPATTATGGISGRLTLESGAAASYAQVLVRNADTWDIADTWADEDGRFAFGGLPVGNYIVSYRSGGPEQFYRQRKYDEDADLVAVTTGQTTTVNDQFLPTSTITGQIRDGAGNPVPDLLISANSVDRGGWNWGMTDADGRYAVAVWPGTYTVSFDPIADSYQTQFVPGEISETAAGRFTVPENGTVVANDTLLPTGTVTGRLTTASGQPAAGAEVHLSAFDGPGGGPEWQHTDGTGSFTFPTVLVGTYRAGFSDSENRSQYYKGTIDEAAATPVVVTAGNTTTVNDSWLGTGSVRVRATDSVTGAPVPNFCVQDGCSNGTGVVVAEGLPQGRHELYLYIPDKDYWWDSLTVDVVAGETVEATIRLRPAARITTTIVDRSTGKGVADICLDALVPMNIREPEGRGDCSDATGKIVVGPLESGSYRLFAVPMSFDSPYGRQWVGTAGGTGDEREAVTVTTAAGSMAGAPKVLLDRAGSITGRVLDGAGAPLRDAQVSVVPRYYLGEGEAWTGSDGQYRIDRLGPYRWPLFYSADGFAPQWSGGAGNRYEAQTIQVTVGGTASFDTRLSTGTEVTGTFTIAGGVVPEGGTVFARNAATGDSVGMDGLRNGRYTMRVLPGQKIRFSYEVDVDGERHRGWFSPPVTSTPPPPPGRRPTGNSAAGATAPAPVDPPTATAGAAVEAGSGGPIATATRPPVSGNPTPTERRVGGVYVVPATGPLIVNITVSLN
ncbi:carboxypeptidase regulatory-like domain-containing protein [Plantactinospora sp. GCM10030261]|uniref:carboxypeptidase regulatory-like domain-containing protein n=1 Tax=Plantactinospora sp. GCM10030261 TaxID=3273420 RepID=UPI0036197BA8